MVGPGSPMRPSEWIEGPSLVRRGAAWLLYGDAYRDHHYTLMSSTDLRDWTDETGKLQMPAGARHGTVFRAPREAVSWLRE